MSGPAKLPIVECGDPVLRRPAELVGPSDLRTSKLQLLIAQMRATMEAAPGVGLAAPQVGIPIQLAVLHDGPERWGQLSRGLQSSAPCWPQGTADQRHLTAIDRAHVRR